MISAEINKSNKEDHAETEFALFSLIVSELFSIDYVHQLSFLYMLNIVASHQLVVCKRELLYMQVINLAGLKIVPTIKNL